MALTSSRQNLTYGDTATVSLNTGSAGPGETFVFQNVGFAYSVNGYAGNFPALTLYKGRTYTFDFQAVTSSHPIALRLASGNTSAVPGTTGNDPANGVHSSGAIVTYAVPLDAPSSIVYQCVFHSGMIGTINLVDDPNPGVPDGTQIGYTITGVTSSEINGQSLTGNFVISSGVASFNLTASVEKFRLISIKAVGYDPITLAVYDLRSGPELVVEGGIARRVAQFNSAGTYTWTVPSGITEISATVVGGGGGGMSSTSGGSGGGGGDLRIKSFSVTPGNGYDITVGSGGNGGGAPTAGGFSRMAFGGIPVLIAAGGGAGRANNTSDAKNGTSTALGSGVTGGDGGIGIAAGSTALAGGGGGAGGYSGNGGNGGGGSGNGGSAGSGGGGGGGGAAGSAANAGSGGGVGLYGPGPSGAAGTWASGGGGGGSSGQAGRTGTVADSNFGGGLYGGGGGGADNATAANFSPGGTGAVAITYAAEAALNYRSAIRYGEDVDIFLTTENVQDGTEVSYAITGISSSEIGNFPLTGNVTIYNNVAYLGFLPTVNSPRLINVSFTGRGAATIALYEFSQGPKLVLESGEIKLVTQFTAPGIYTWTPPAGSSSISATVIGGGGGGMSNTNGGSGGGGGDLRQSSALSVTAGNVYDITVGSGGSGGTVPTAGGFSQIALSGTPLLIAAGGGTGRTNNTSDAKNGTSSVIGSVELYVGQQEFTTPETTSWTAPPGVTSVCVVCVGGGGAGQGNDRNGGAGGGLGWKNNITVVPGTSYTVVVGSGGAANTGQSGTASYFIDTSTVAGLGGQGSSVGGELSGGGYVGDGGGNGGSSRALNAGGGGAGGYSGNGGNGGRYLGSPNTLGLPGSGGGGGGGGGNETLSTGYPAYLNSPGGGVGIYGEGASGAGGSTTVPGGGGSGGEQAPNHVFGGLGSVPGARYGGGGASNLDGSRWGGGDGAVRIIWGPSRAFPSTNTIDQTPSSGLIVVGGDGGVGRASGGAATAGGGGGAGGYSGNGGDGSGVNGFRGAGGGGGGGSGSGSTQTAGSGGGVGLYGRGPDGSGGIYDATAGNPGGGGSSGISGENGAQSRLGVVFSQNLYGGGGAGQDNTTAAKIRDGGSGAVAIRYAAPPGLYASEDEIVSGYGFTITLVTDGAADGTTFQYTISGVTSGEINGAALTGVFTVYNDNGSINLVGNIPSGEYRTMMVSVTGYSSATVVIRNFLNLFTPNYRPLIENFQGTKKFIDLRRGSDSNNGDSDTSAWASLYYAMETTSADANPVMFVIAPGDYYLAPVYTSSFASWSITDSSQPRTFMCVPGRVNLRWIAGSQRDAPLINLGNSASEVYGARFFRNNNGKGLSYSVALINNATALMRGKLYNCLITETNPNGNWSFTYGVPPASPAVELRNCTLYFQQMSTGDYNVGTNLQLIDGVSTVALSNTLATKTNFLESAPVEPVEYRVPFEYSRGVYSGSYRWAPLTEKILLSRETLEERQSFSAVYESKLEISRTETYALSGVSTDDIVGGSLTGSFGTENYRGSFLIVTRADYDFNEGTETITINISGATASLTLTDLPSALFFDQSSVSAGAVITATLIVNNLASGTLIPYTVSGVTQEQLGDFPITGNFIIDSNNTGEISISTGTIPGATLSISADGNVAVCQVTFSAGIATPTMTVTSESLKINVAPRIINNVDSVDQLKFPVTKTVSEVDQSTGAFVIRPLGVELIREYWI